MADKGEWTATVVISVALSPISVLTAAMALLRDYYNVVVPDRTATSPSAVPVVTTTVAPPPLTVTPSSTPAARTKNSTTTTSRPAPRTPAGPPSDMDGDGIPDSEEGGDGSDEGA